MGKESKQWEALSNKPGSMEPQSDRELLMVVVNEIRHLMNRIDEIAEEQNELKKSICAPTPLYQEIKTKMDNLSASLEEVKTKVKDIEKAQNDICITQERFDTYFKILGAIAIIFPTLLVALVQVV